jgi:hypothetical protein
VGAYEQRFTFREICFARVLEEVHQRLCIVVDPVIVQPLEIELADLVNPDPKASNT